MPHKIVDFTMAKTNKVHPVPLAFTRLCQVDSSALIIWTGPFPIKGIYGYFYYYHVL